MKKSNQHYVPRSILRNFGNPTQVWCLFKDQNGKCIESAVENLCAEKDFYSFSLDIEDENNDISEMFDYDLQVFDGIDKMIAPIVRSILTHGSIDRLSDSDKKNLAKYVVYQYMRSPAIRNMAISHPVSEEEARQFQGVALLDTQYMDRTSDIIYNLNLKLLNAGNNERYIISDSPVLWSPTAEGIYFPLSPEYCLCYQKEDVDTLDSICINRLEFLASLRFNISKDQETLNDIWKNTNKKHIDEFCNGGIDSYWKCILKFENSEQCIEGFKNSIFEGFK